VSERVFVDTNVLVYADDLDAGEKASRACSLYTDMSGVLSTQVLQEFFVVSWLPRERRRPTRRRPHHHWGLTRVDELRLRSFQHTRRCPGDDDPALERGRAARAVAL
jgi:hypothetical protein